MARLVTVTDADGKEYTVNCENITHIEHELGEPAVPAVPAQEEVKDDPGEEPSYAHPEGRPPKKGSPKVEAKPGKDATPDKSTIKFVGGDSIEVAGSVKALRELLG
jgi:hypothetical protein